MRDLGSFLAKPQGEIARWMDVIAVSAAGLCSIFSYFLIEFEICQAYACKNLVVTSFYASASWWYLVFGIALLGIGLFIHRARDLQRAFAMAITVSSLSGFVLSGMVVFAILKEARLTA